MGTMGKTATLAALLALALFPPPAAAVRVVAPPGNSEADQYFETLPSPSGPRAPVARKDAPKGALGEATERALEQRGSTGLALATAVARTAPARWASGKESPDTAPLPASAVRIPGDPGLGALFPLLLVTAAAWAVAFAVVYQRRPGAK
jgi:hypothetical protein